MPISDKISRPNNGTLAQPATLTSNKSTTVDTATISTIIGWPDDATYGPVHFALFKVGTDGLVTDGTTTYWKATLAGSTLSNMTITGGTNQPYSSGDSCIIYPTPGYGNDLYDFLSKAHNKSDGSLKTSEVQAALNIGGIPADWTPLAAVPTIINSYGQREHKIRFTGVDYTDRLQAGTKLRIPRTVAVPNLSSVYSAASSQYASKVSPTNVSFTADFTVEAWITLDAFTGNDISIASRYDNTNGFVCYLNNQGQIIIGGYGASNNKVATSIQSIPINKKVHIAAALQMSTGNAQMFIDGVSVGANTGGTATSFTQAGNLQIGRHGTGTNYFNGKISDVRIWSTIRTAQQIRDNMNLQLVGNEAGLVAYYKLSGDFNDSTANANNLTSSGGAVATFADSPFSSIEYAIITSVSLVTGNTEAIVYTGQNALPNNTLGTAAYSSARTPFGFPSQKRRWTVDMYSRAVINLGTNGVWSSGGLSIAIPTGEWDVTYNMATYVDRGATQTLFTQQTLSTTNNSNADSAWDTMARSAVSGGSAFLALPMAKSGAIINAAQTVYYPNNVAISGDGTLGNHSFNNSNQGTSNVSALCAYL